MATNNTPTANMAEDKLQTPRMELHRAASSTSVDTAVSTTSLASEASSTSTAETTPHHSRATSAHDDPKPSGMTDATDAQLSGQLKQSLNVEVKKTLGTGLEIPRNATPSQMSRTKTPVQDPWTLEYPAPTTEVDVAACLARKKLYVSSFQKQQERDAKMGVEEREAKDAKIAARDAELARERRANMMKNLLRPLG